MATVHHQRYHPTPTDGFPTATSHAQAETEAVLREHLPSRVAAPSADGSAAQTATNTTNTDTRTKDVTDVEAQLRKKDHMQFLVRHLVNGFPARYLSQDASQPWLLFWTLQAFSALQVGIDKGNGQR